MSDAATPPQPQPQPQPRPPSEPEPSAAPALPPPHARVHSSPPFQIGSYRLERPLGSGGMSSVFLATHAESGHEVALKILPRTLAQNPVLLQRFLREAKSAEALDHPNIVAIFDRGTEQGRYYLVLEYVPGGDLHDWVQERGPMPVSQAIRVIKGVAKGLDYAARQGLVHRDIKPANILMTPEGVPKIIDLGLAVQVSEEDERVTRDGTTVGTVDYMAPEQARDSRATSIHSDMYSLGCTFYHLLTGNPPFAGGGVPEKLRRHAHEAPPDVTAARPDVPPELGRVLSKMLAKKAGQRYGGYGELITALEKVEGVASQANDDGLYALVDDDGDDFALVDDEEELAPTAEVKAPARPRSDSEAVGAKKQRSPAAPEDRGLNLADLAALDEDTGSTDGRSERKKRAAAAPAPSPSIPLPRTHGEPVAGVDPPSVEEEVFEGAISAPVPRTAYRGSGGDEDLRVWILRGFLIGLGVVLLVLGIQFLLSLGGNTEEWTEEGEPPAPLTEAPPVPADVPSTGPVSEAAAKADLAASPPSPPGVSSSPPSQPAQLVPPSALVKEEAWTELPDREVKLGEEPRISQALENAFTPDWTREQSKETGAPQVVVTRVGLLATASGDASHARSLSDAWARSSGLVEVADSGPFFEDDLQLGGKSRHVRAAEGYRPIVVLRGSSQPLSRGETALFTIEGFDLTLEGLDLVVEVDALPAAATALFSCRGGKLELRRCTVTFLSSEARRLVMARVGEVGRVAPLSSPKLLLENTLVRGGQLTAVEYMEGGGEVVFRRSVVMVGQEPLVDGRRGVGATAGGSRSLVVLRSMFSSADCVVHALGAGNAPPLTIRALGSVFSSGKSGDAALLMLLQGDPAAGVTAAVDWGGDSNHYVGWSGWLGVKKGEEVQVRIQDLASARISWPGQEGRSRESSARWSEEIFAGTPWIEPGRITALVGGDPACAPILGRVAAPVSWLPQKSVIPFPAVGIPEAAQGDPSRMSLVLDASLGGVTDLGKYLATQIARVSGPGEVLVRVRGEGAHPMTPFRMPDGVALRIEVQPPDGEGGEPLCFRVGPGGDAGGLIEVRNADLTILGGCFEHDGSGRRIPFVRVQDGHLRLWGCRFLDSAPGTAEGRRLIEFEAKTTRPLPMRPGREASLGDRPTALVEQSVLITGGTAIRADVGRGLLALKETAIVAGEIALDLAPAAVARDRFAADLLMDRCTLAARETFVMARAWPGQPPGPERPWLVTSVRSAFLDSFARVSSSPERAVFLRSEPGGMAIGAFFWQSRGDAYDLVHFCRWSAGPAAMTPGLAPDLQRDWVRLWGSAHVQAVTGPGMGGPAVVFSRGPLSVAEVRPEAMAVGRPGEEAKNESPVGAPRGVTTAMPKAVAAAPDASVSGASAKSAPTKTAAPKAKIAGGQPF